MLQQFDIYKALALESARRGGMSDVELSEMRQRYPDLANVWELIAELQDQIEESEDRLESELKDAKRELSKTVNRMHYFALEACGHLDTIGNATDDIAQHIDRVGGGMSLMRRNVSSGLGSVIEALSEVRNAMGDLITTYEESDTEDSQ